MLFTSRDAIAVAMIFIASLFASTAWSNDIVGESLVESQHALQNSTLVEFTPSERNIILSLGPWPPKRSEDHSNKVSGNAEAIHLGQQLFFDPALSSSGAMACVSCHIPQYHFTDRLATARGVDDLDRNTPSLLNSALNRWYGWGGESDSLWAHSIRPMTAAEEMSATPESIQLLMMGNADYARAYMKVFSQSASLQTPEDVMVNVAKVLAAYQETLVTPRVNFDVFRDALESNSVTVMQRYPLAAQRGLKLFVSKGNCHFCHSGANFTNGEFADIGMPFFTANGVDSGRYGGVKAVKESSYNLLGTYNDESDRSGIHTGVNVTGNGAIKSVQYVSLQHKNWGEFKVPSLRGVVHTPPYMHNGSVKTLADVINHYSTVDSERLHTEGVNIVKALNLTSQESEDLLAFLQSLSSP